MKDFKKMAELTLWQNENFRGKDVEAPTTGIPNIEDGARSLKLQSSKDWTVFEGAEYRGANYNIGKTAECREPADWGGKNAIHSARPIYMGQ
ncbi:hypothetical protein KUTeg_005853 [Tegillarca granosa]|uniref:Beta/gamma crystallin 'Greek key' domain-containing protein n=1 Tax=Tegillarca granosa TaxID=220873 RepID=A0ABQ9FGZ6_TEGGR|nr:hypothetical protein KUTeg_005853 [Tegillarca granosa]